MDCVSILYMYIQQNTKTHAYSKDKKYIYSVRIICKTKRKRILYVCNVRYLYSMTKRKNGLCVNTVHVYNVH